jgi:predicted RNA-binding Zn-ribbon protein involved in translation (DUF1610 family)
MELTYNLEKDINSGAIEVYAPNWVDRKFKTYDDLHRTAKMHGMNTLAAANNMMSMYKLNYLNKNEKSNEIIRKWEAYYSVVKSNKKHKCKECGWKGMISQMNEGIDSEYSCPECDEDFDLSL